MKPRPRIVLYLPFLLLLFMARAATGAETPGTCGRLEVRLAVHGTKVKLQPLADQLTLLDGESHLTRLVRQLGGDEGAVERDLLPELAETSGGVLSFVDAANAVIAVVDQDMLGRRTASAGTWLTTLFPGSAQEAQQRFGIRIHSLRQLDVPLAEATLSGERMVLLVHGLDDPGGLWGPMIRELVHRDYLVGEFIYPNDQAIDRSSEFLAGQLLMLHRFGIRRVDIVAHSMGGLVSRNLLTHKRFYGGDGTGNRFYPRIDRLITIGTPNHGSRMARFRFASEAAERMTRFMRGEKVLFDAASDGAAERDLLPGSHFLKDLNARPLPSHTRLTVIAGRASPIDSTAFDGLAALVAQDQEAFREQMMEAIDGLGDGCVTLASSRLEGVDDYHVVDADHLGMIIYREPRQSELPPALPIVLRKLAEQ